MAAPLPSETFAHDPSGSFTALFEAEERHFWFRARNKVLERVVSRLVAPLPPGYRVLEVGCGTGNVLRVLERVCARGEVIGTDLYEDGLRYARRRVRCPLLAGDIHTMTFPHRFDLIGLFDVLEHLPDDTRILRALRDNLKPGGRLLLTVPAHRALWSYADEYGGHYRRYSPRQLRDLLEATGFRVEYLTQFMMLLYPFLWLGRRWNGRGRDQSLRQRKEQSDRELRPHPFVNALLYRLLSWERWWLRRRLRLPLGTSLLAVATVAAATSPLDAPPPSREHRGST
jgi:SAM-dependent methyltransferase